MDFRKKLALFRPYQYLILVVLLYFSVMYFAYIGNYNTVYGRYEYTGPDSMSFFGFLDLAHYRTVGTEELLGWQFFFGNLPFFVLCALFTAGIYLYFQPLSLKNLSNPNSSEFSTPKSDLKEQSSFRTQKSILIILIVLVVAVFIIELIAALINRDEIGWGSSIFIGSYFRTIPQLLTQGYYVQNAVPAYPQTLLSYMPFLFGWFAFPLSRVIRSQEKLDSTKYSLRKSPTGTLLLFIGGIWLLGIILNTEITLQTSFTGYTLYLTVFWFFCSYLTAGMFGIITKTTSKTNSKSIQIKEDSVKTSELTIRWSPKTHLLGIFSLVLTILAPISVLFPYMEFVDLGNDIKFGEGILPIILLVLLILSLSSFLKALTPTQKLQWGSFLQGFVILLYLVAFMLLKNSLANIEIAWIYNGIIPLMFTSSLTLIFYFIGLKLTPVILKAQKILHFQKVRTCTKEKLLSKRGKLGLTLATLVVFSSIGGVLLNKLFGEQGQILVNNLGFLPTQEKSFFLATTYDHDETGTFYVFNADTDAMVMSGTLERSGMIWKRYHWKGDFTALNTPGKYYIKSRLGGVRAESFVFAIDSTYLESAFTTSLYWYYYMRCGTAVESIHDGYVGHEACHTHDAWVLVEDPDNASNYIYVHSNDIGMNLSGGWHDSGDYNVYGGVRVPPLYYSLVWSFDQLPEFFFESPRIDAYPSNDSIPDILEEAWFGTQYWLNRWYTPENLWFDTCALGENGDLRWTVFGAPEYEEDFADGRWIDDDDEGTGGNPITYGKQFVNSSNGLLTVASLAAFSRICKQYGFYSDQLNAVDTMLLDAYESYMVFYGKNSHSLVANWEMYKWGNETDSSYFTNATQIIDQFIADSGNTTTNFPDFLTMSYVLKFAQEYNGHLGWQGLAYIEGNHTIENFYHEIESRTQEMFGILREQPEGFPEYHNGAFFSAMMLAGYAWNMTTNSTIKTGLFNFITNHYDWTFGRNMDNICMLEGVKGGDNPVWQYDKTRYRFIKGNLRGAYPGFIPDGYEYYPGDYESLSSRFESHNDLTPLRRYNHIYTEVWSDVTFRFVEMNAAVFSQVLGY